MTFLGRIERYWSEYAERFDDDPDHGLHDPSVRRAWAEHLERWIASPAQRIADLGCGTGSLCLLLAEQGHTVTGVDLSPRMIERANDKRAGAPGTVQLVVADAGDPPLGLAAFDVVLCRHVLWTLPDPDDALRRWRSLLKPDGRLIAIEGHWFEPAGEQPSGAAPWNGGVSAGTLLTALDPLFGQLEHVPLSGLEELWGGPVTDERYAVIATQPR